MGCCGMGCCGMGCCGRVQDAGECWQIGRAGEVAEHGSSGGNGGRDEMGPAAPPLSAFEVAVAGAGRALADGELVRVHCQTHAAPGLAPIGARRSEDRRQSFGFGLGLDGVTSRYDQHTLGRDGASLHDGRRSAHVLDPAIGATADEDGVDGDVANGGARFEIHVFERPLDIFARRRIVVVRR